MEQFCKDCLYCKIGLNEKSKKRYHACQAHIITNYVTGAKTCASCFDIRHNNAVCPEFKPVQDGSTHNKDKKSEMKGNV
jgi:hypothetical protein